jgi:probable F420-dependent oxidoreductase
VNFSLWLWPYGRWGGLDSMALATEQAESLGFVSVSVSDHTVCPRGPDAAGVTDVWPDWSVLSTYLAMRTQTIRILTTLVVPYRPVLPTAKQIATIDAISDGRFTLAAAVGWLQREFEMLGVSYADRGAITDEYLRAMKVLWTEDEPEFSGRHVSFRDIVFEPKCTQSPHVPIWIAGGTGPAPVRRLLELGEGWMPMGGGLDDGLRDTVLRIKDCASTVGRDPDAIAFRYTIGVGTANAELQTISQSISVDEPTALGNDGTAESVAAEIASFEEAGFTELAINFSGESGPEVMEQLEWFGAEVMPLL